MLNKFTPQTYVVDDSFPIVWESFDENMGLVACVEVFCIDLGNFIITTADGNMVWKEITPLNLVGDENNIHRPSVETQNVWEERFNEFIDHSIKNDAA